MAGQLFRAKLYMTPVEEGGRKAPFRAGYRPQFHIAASDFCTSFMIQKIDGAEQVAPGDSATVEAFLLSPEGLGVPIPSGISFELREGHTVIARGIIEKYI